jgi:hypothetical protein
VVRDLRVATDKSAELARDLGGSTQVSEADRAKSHASPALGRRGTVPPQTRPSAAPQK